MKIIFLILLTGFFSSFCFATHPCIVDSSGNIIGDCDHEVITNSKDSLVIIPEKPNSSDSVEFKLYLPNYDCCTIFHNVSTWVEDSVIYLFFNPETPEFKECDCLLPGSWVLFKTANIPAGIYDIFKNEQIYCGSNEPCPPLFLAPVWLGELTVTGAAAIIPITRYRHNNFKIFPNPIKSNGGVTFTNSHPFSQLSIFDISGRSVKIITNINSNIVKWNTRHLSDGLYIVKATIGNQIYSKKVLLQK